MAQPQKRNWSKFRRNTNNTDVCKQNTQVNCKKQRFHKLMEQQRKIEQSKSEKRSMIEAKRKARKMKRKDRNAAWCKLTKKGQPIMKERINYLLKELEAMSK